MYLIGIKMHNVTLYSEQFQGDSLDPYIFTFILCV